MWGWVIAAVAGAILIKDNIEENARKKIPCTFSQGISKSEFDEIVRKSAMGIKRLKNIDIDGPIVSGTVKSQSGLHLWTFEIDFNDHGHVTGNHWINSQNKDSEVPRIFAKRIQEQIYNR